MQVKQRSVQAYAAQSVLARLCRAWPACLRFAECLRHQACICSATAHLSVSSIYRHDSKRPAALLCIPRY